MAHSKTCSSVKRYISCLIGCPYLLTNEKILNKKVLLLERKKHTTRHVASNRCAALFPREVPTLARQEGGVTTPGQGVPTLAGVAILAGGI